MVWGATLGGPEREEQQMFCQLTRQVVEGGDEHKKSRLSQSGLYPRRTSGGNHHHRYVGRAALAGR